MRTAGAAFNSTSANILPPQNEAVATRPAPSERTALQPVTIAASKRAANIGARSQPIDVDAMSTAFGPIAATAC